jgi:hypothetical protein
LYAQTVTLLTYVDTTEKDMTLQTKQCPACNTEFICGPQQGAESCWCSTYPTIIPVENGQACLCPECLAILVSETINSHIDASTHEQALRLASQHRSNKTLIENIDYSIEAGNLVFTRWYHLKRGTCCDNGCRHCPYK